MKPCASRAYDVCICVLLTLNIARSFGGHSVHFSKRRSTQKQLIVDRNRQRFGLRGILWRNMGTFNLHVKVILDHLVYFAQNWAVTQKQSPIE